MEEILQQLMGGLFTVLPHYYKVLYIPGGDRRISEASTVVIRISFNLVEIAKMGNVRFWDIHMNEKRSGCLEILWDSTALSHRDCCFPI